MVQPIAASFHASNQSSWLGTSFLLANITFTPLYGRLCDTISRRAANGSAIAFFTIGTALCGLAPSMKLLFLGRFVAGLGGGGISVTSSIIVCDLLPLKQRALAGAISNGIWAVSTPRPSEIMAADPPSPQVGAALGGPLGGLVTDAFGWRVAFLGQVPLLLVALLSSLKNVNYAVEGAREGETTREKLRRIDFAGCGCIFVAFSSFLVSLSLRNNELLPVSHALVLRAELD